MHKTQNEEELGAPYRILFLRIRCNEGPVMRRKDQLKYTSAIAFRQKRNIPSREAWIGLFIRSNADEK